MHSVKVMRAVATDVRFLLIVLTDVSQEVLFTIGEICLIEMDAAHLASSVVGVWGRRSQSVGELCVSSQVEAEVRQV